jgi:ribosome-associated protein
MIVHIMQPAIRAYYRLEEIWGDKEVKMGAAKRAPKGLASASEIMPSEKPKRASRSKAVPAEVTPDMMAIQTTLDDEKKPVRKSRAPKATTATASSAAPAIKKPRVKIPTGTRVKVASTKTASASAKQAAVKRTTTRKKAAE